MQAKCGGSLTGRQGIGAFPSVFSFSLKIALEKIPWRRTQPMCNKRPEQLARIVTDENMRSTAICCESYMGYAHVARLREQLQKDED